MTEYFENKEEIPILSIKEINYNNPFIIIELIEFNNSLNIKVRYVNNDFDIVKLKYQTLKKIIINTILVVNCYIVDIKENRDNIHDAILDYYNNYNNDNKIIK